MSGEKRAGDDSVDVEKENPETPEIRVTDRRRIYLDDVGKGSDGGTAQEPNLKPTYVEELEARTKAAEKKAQEIEARFEQLRMQLQSETDETRQRLNRSADQRAERAKAQLIMALLPVVDDLRRATDAAAGGNSPMTIIEGIQQTIVSFEKALRSEGVEPISAVGEIFDPQLHEAVETIAVEREDDGRVTAEYTRGYRIGDQLIRPARVQVGAAPRSEQAASD
ncbi:MAG TPA: nucleotide exchange factor GrpE [Pyrinomonadaceae bacterium]|nr:nucleotide exchange factor GrpE [Pyrinomonadaceae bacterium]